MNYRNRICPYTCQPISAIEVSSEHIVPDALGGPESFALAADKPRNSAYGASVDIRLIRSPLMGMAAARAGVETRNGPSTWKTQGQLVADDSPVELIGSKDSVQFRFRKPVEVDPETRQVRAVKGFGAGVDRELARVSADLLRKGRELVPIETKVLDSGVRGSFAHNLSEAVQGLSKIAYLATVWAVGDGFINTAAGAQYRSWLDVEPTAEALESAGLRPVGASMFKTQGMPSQHHIACVISGQTVLTGVRLFNHPLFELTLAVEAPELQLLDGHGHLVTIDAATKTFEDRLLVP
jgi:hypothetical protein